MLRVTVRREPALPPDGIAAGQRDGDVAHRGVSLGAVPMTLARFDMSDVANLDLSTFVFCRDPLGAGRDDQNLIAVVHVPARVASLAEVHDATVIVFRVSRLDDGLTGAMHGPSVPICRFRRARRWTFRDILQRDNLHGELSPSCPDPWLLVGRWPLFAATSVSVVR